MTNRSSSGSTFSGAWRYQTFNRLIDKEIIREQTSWGAEDLS